jgi:hypothetical protein
MLQKFGPSELGAGRAASEALDAGGPGEDPVHDDEALLGSDGFVDFDEEAADESSAEPELELAASAEMLAGQADAERLSRLAEIGSAGEGDALVATAAPRTDAVTGQTGVWPMDRTAQWATEVSPLRKLLARIDARTAVIEARLQTLHIELRALQPLWQVGRRNASKHMVGAQTAVDLVLYGCGRHCIGCPHPHWLGWYRYQDKASKRVRFGRKTLMKPANAASVHFPGVVERVREAQSLIKERDKLVRRLTRGAW